MKKVRATAYVTQYTKDEIVKLSEENGRSESDMTRILIQDALRERKTYKSLPALVLGRENKL